ncbi:MAG: M48 family metalloprotease [Nitrospinota bacterium]|nr:M48 family metalloprotease [Nitrospinota bacterium]
MKKKNLIIGTSTLTVSLIFMAVSISYSAIADAQNSARARARAHNQIDWTNEDDIKAEIVFGREVAARIIGRYSLYKNDNLTRYCNLIARSLAENSNRPELQFKVGILDTPTVNAFAAPGGYIFITKGAIEAMENEAELAATIAHEITHISQKHIVKELNIRGKSGSSEASLGKLIGGGGETMTVAFTQAVDNAMNVLFQNGYAQKDEQEADTLGIMLAASLGYNPEALANLFRRMEKAESNKVSSLIKLHPAFSNRIKWVEETIQNEGLSGGEFRTESARFNRFKKG